MNKLAATPKHSIIQDMATQFHMERAAFEATLKKTILPADVSNEELCAFLIVAKEYQLNPFTKEIYGFPTRGGGIQPVVSIDGWLNIINSHKQFDGMTFEDTFSDDAKLVAVTCCMYRKDREHPVEVTEYMEECYRDTDTWKKYPARMLRHKATIQAARYAFGFSGIVDPDEADRIIDMGDVVIDESAKALGATAETAANLRAKMSSTKAEKTPDSRLPLDDGRPGDASENDPGE